jgi:hypothetical protein
LRSGDGKAQPAIRARPADSRSERLPPRGLALEYLPFYGQTKFAVTDRRIAGLNRISALVSADPDLSFRAIEKLQGLQPEYFEAAYSEDFQGQCECNLAP